MIPFMQGLPFPSLAIVDDDSESEDDGSKSDDGQGTVSDGEDTKPPKSKSRYTFSHYVILTIASNSNLTDLYGAS